MRITVFDAHEKQSIMLQFEEGETQFIAIIEDEQAEQLLDIIQNKLNARK